MEPRMISLVTWKGPNLSLSVSLSLSLMAARLLTRRTPSLSQSLTLTFVRLSNPSSPLDSIPSAAAPRCIQSLISVASRQLQHGDRVAIPPYDARSGAHRASRFPDLAGSTPPLLVAPRFAPATTILGPLGSGKICGYDRLSLYKPQHAVGIQTFPRWLWMKSEGGTLKHLTDDNVCPQLNHLSEKDKMVISFSPLEKTMRISGLRNESWKIKITELSQKLTFALIPALLVISKTKLTTSLLVFSVYWQIYGFFKEIFLDYVHQEVTRKWVLLYFKLLLLILAKDTILDFGLI